MLMFTSETRRANRDRARFLFNTFAGARRQFVSRSFFLVRSQSALFRERMSLASDVECVDSTRERLAAVEAINARHGRLWQLSQWEIYELLLFRKNAKFVRKLQGILLMSNNGTMSWATMSNNGTMSSCLSGNACWAKLVTIQERCVK